MMFCSSPCTIFKGYANLPPMRFHLLLLFLCFSLSLSGHDRPCIQADLIGQMGNQMFEVAAASALAWDHDGDAYFPQMNPADPHYKHVFFRCCIEKPPIAPLLRWKEPSFAYHPIPFLPNLQLDGYFQSEKYFRHHRERILELFAPLESDLQYIQNKYGKLLEHPVTVGVQLRRYNDYPPSDTRYIQYGKDYFMQAMELFPEEALFLVSTNSISFAKQCLPEKDNVVFLQHEADYIDLFILSLCRHNIISNSSFGWWGGWLNRNPEKMIICPKIWVNPNWNLPTQDVCPEDWIKLEARWGNSRDPRSCD